MDLGYKDNHPLADNTYESIIMPIIFGFIAVLTPTFTKIGLGILSIYLIIGFAYIYYAKKRNLHEYVRWRVVHNAVHVNVATLFAMSILWRFFGHSLWLLLFFIVVHIVAVIVGVCFKKLINLKLHAPNKKWRHIIGFIGGIGAGGAAVITYALTPTFPAFMLIFMYIGLLFVAIIFNAQWLYAVEPHWKPE